jgi:methylmalonyl-CoA/ethylmalonyl-CoA epimerase
VFRVTDLKIVSIATPDLDGAVTTFRKNFAFPIQRTGVEAHDPKTRRVFLGVGPAEIEIAAPTAQDSPLASFLADRGAGLYELVLEVDDLEAARAALSERGVEVTLAAGVDGKPSGGLDQKQTHGVRITLVER